MPYGDVLPPVYFHSSIHPVAVPASLSLFSSISVFWKYCHSVAPFHQSYSDGAGWSVDRRTRYNMHHEWPLCKMKTLAREMCYQNITYTYSVSWGERAHKDSKQQTNSPKQTLNLYRLACTDLAKISLWIRYALYIVEKTKTKKVAIQLKQHQHNRFHPPPSTRTGDILLEGGHG